MKTANITAVHQTAHHQYGSQGETVYNVTLENGWTGWIVGFGGDHMPTKNPLLIASFTGHADPVDEDMSMIGTVIAVDWTTRTASISGMPVGRGHYQWLVHLDDKKHILTDTDGRSYDEIRGAGLGDPEAVGAKLRKIEEVIEAYGMACWAVRYSPHPRWGEVFEADVEE